MKKIISIMACVCIIFSSFAAVGVRAERVTYTQDFKAAFYDALLHHETGLDIEKFNINEYSIIENTFFKLASLPEFFHVKPTMKVAVDSNGYFLNIHDLEYYYDKEQSDAMRLEYDAVANKIIEDLLDNPVLCDVEKALLVHDRLAVHCKYDIVGANTHTADMLSFSLYGALVNRLAVCQGYSEAYMYMLEKLGIESRLCRSDKLNHTWNIVVINGEEYHVDVTWDDPVPDTLGEVKHDNFLLSTAALKRTTLHNADDYDESPNSTIYDDYFWQNSDTEFQLVGDEIYYLDNTDQEIKAAKNMHTLEDEQSVTAIYYEWLKDEDHIHANDHSNNFGKLASHENDLFFCDGENIYVYDTESLDIGRIYAPDLSQFSPYTWIFGLASEDDYLIYEISTSPMLEDAKRFKYYIGADAVHDYEGITHRDGEWYYVANGHIKYDATGMFEIIGHEYYVLRGKIMHNTTGIVEVNDKRYYVEHGVKQLFDGFVTVNGISYYFKRGICEKKTTFLIIDDKYVYIEDGIKTNLTGLYEIEGILYQFTDGDYSRYTGFADDNDGNVRYFKNGTKQNVTGFVLHNEHKYYVANGVFKESTTLVSVGNYLYYINRGILQENATTLFKYNNKWYYIKNGVWNKSTALIKQSNGSLYYIEGGIWNQTITGLYSFGDKIYSFKDGIVLHTYDSLSDDTCNVCGAKRTLVHSYKTTITKATTTKGGSIVKKCTICGKTASKTTIYYPKTIKLSTTSYTYNGKVKTPTVTVKDSQGKTISSSNYKVSYASGRKNVGKYKVTVTFKGNYSGTKTLYFAINPPKTTVSKLTAAKKSLKVAITKKSTQVTGYQIQYSAYKTFKSAKTKTITSYKTTSTTLKLASSKKTYYVRVRTYKTVGKTKYYSGWSTYKYKKTK